MRLGGGAQRLDHHALAIEDDLLGVAARLVELVVGVDLQAQRLRLGPVGTHALGQRIELRGQQFEALGVAALGIHLQQLGAHRQPVGRGAHGFLEDFLGLQIPAVGQVDIGLGHRVDIADGVELAERVAHRAGIAVAAVAGVDPLAAAGTEE